MRFASCLTLSSARESDPAWSQLNIVFTRYCQHRFDVEYERRIASTSIINFRVRLIKSPLGIVCKSLDISCMSRATFFKSFLHFTCFTLRSTLHISLLRYFVPCYAPCLCAALLLLHSLLCGGRQSNVFIKNCVFSLILHLLVCFSTSRRKLFFLLLRHRLLIHLLLILFFFLLLLHRCFKTLSFELSLRPPSKWRCCCFLRVQVLELDLINLRFISVILISPFFTIVDVVVIIYDGARWKLARIQFTSFCCYLSSSTSQLFALLRALETSVSPKFIFFSLNLLRPCSWFQFLQHATCWWRSSIDAEIWLE